MASVKDAVEESLQDNNAIIKYIVFTIPLFYTVTLMLQGNNSGLFFTVLVLTFLLLFGFMLKCTYNVRNGNICVLPSFNIFSIFWDGIKGSIALAPLSIVSFIIYGAVTKFISPYMPDGNFSNIFNGIIAALCVSFAFTGYLLYTKKFSIFDAYNIKAITKYCADVMIAMFFMAIQIVIVNAIILIPVTYIIWLFFGIPNPVAIYFWSMVGILNLAIMGHYLAQIHYEIIETDEKADKII